MTASIQNPQPENSTLIITRLGELFLKGRNQGISGATGPCLPAS